MALVNLLGMLDHARRHGYGVGAFNVPDYETLQAILDVAEELSSPVIIDVAEVHLKYIDLDDVAAVVRRAAERASVPVVLHLDHGETFETIIRAVRAGFSSIMFDGSALPYEENVAKTQEIVKICHACGVTVEAELGRVGGGEGGSGRSVANPNHFTDPAQAEDFANRTQVDALAISFGTAHGLYKGTPKLDFPRLKEIARRTQKPLVLHGGTGVTFNDFRKAISLGIAKINFYTQISVAAVERTREVLREDPDLISYPDLLLRAREAVKEAVGYQMRVFGSAGICDRFPDICAECDACVLPTSSLTTASTDSQASAPAEPEPSQHMGRDEVTELIQAVTRAVVEGIKQ